MTVRALGASRGLGSLGKPLGAHAAVEGLVGVAARLLTHRLIDDRGGPAELPIPAERGADVLVDPLLVAARGIGLRPAVRDLMRCGRVVGAGLDPIRRGSRAAQAASSRPARTAAAFRKAEPAPRSKRTKVIRRCLSRSPRRAGGARRSAPGLRASARHSPRAKWRSRRHRASSRGKIRSTDQEDRCRCKARPAGIRRQPVLQPFRAAGFTPT